MKIALTSHSFYPDMGGIETMSMLMAKEFTARGHEVFVVTMSLNEVSDDLPFQVIRRPGAWELFKIVYQSDVLFQNNISLRSLWPLLFIRRPWLVRHATWVSRLDGSLGWQDRIKRLVLRFSTGISNSRAVADSLPVTTAVIGNPYSDGLFRLLPEVKKDRDIVFLGRLVSDKGTDLLLDALRRLRLKGLTPTVTFIGSGPEEEFLRRQVFDFELEHQVEFVGRKSGEELVQLLNRHRIMAVPSLWNEPFGIVALEGIACGCVVVGSEGGGLKDAIGPCGITFTNGDAVGLTAMLEKLLISPDEIQVYTESAPKHLASHTVKYVVGLYLEILASVVEGRK
jgi:glycogen(starch) synthase